MRRAFLALAGTMAIAGAANAGDVRERVQLTAQDREHLKAGMRAYLDDIGGIIAGLARHDFKAVARAASHSGMAAVKDVPVALALRLPPQFTLMSVDTHERFDVLAKEAREKRTNLAVQKALGDVLSNCTACHAMYKF